MRVSMTHYMSTIWHDGEIVSETTSGAWGYRIDKCVALGMVKSGLATEGTVVQIEIYGEKYDATVQADGPLWDRKMSVSAHKSSFNCHAKEIAYG